MKIANNKRKFTKTEKLTESVQRVGKKQIMCTRAKHKQARMGKDGQTCAKRINQINKYGQEWSIIVKNGQKYVKRMQKCAKNVK